MKKLFFFALTATGLALASCNSENEVVEGPPPTTTEQAEKPIGFGSFTGAVTRADYTGSDAAGLLNNNFVVEGVKGNGTAQEVVFDNYNVNWTSGTANTTASNTSNWEYVGVTKHPRSSITRQVIKYWDYQESQYDFIAYSKGLADAVYTGTPTASQVLYSAITPGTLSTSAYTITGKASELAKTYIADMVTAYRDPIATTDYNKTVQFKFRSLSAKVRLAIYETVPGYSIKDVVFYTDNATAASDGKAHLYTTGSEVFNEEGTYTVYYPTTGSSNKTNSDYNKAHVKFTAAASGTQTIKDFGTLSNYANKEDGEASGAVYLGRDLPNATYAGTAADKYYTIVIPNETGAVLNLKVNYTLVSTDGSNETINVTGASAQVPAEYAKWKSGYAYTYIFKISDKTNGKTNPTEGPVGLYPITFDAVVTETEDGIQETITNVTGATSITTFGVKGGQFVHGNNEYTTGTSIYITIENNGTVVYPAFMSQTHIYKVTTDDATLSPISEATVADYFEKPIAGTKVIHCSHMCTTWYDTGKLRAVSSVPGEDGNARTVNAIRMTPGTTDAGYYAVRYIAPGGGSFKYETVIGLTDDVSPVTGFYTYDSGTDTYTEVTAADAKAESGVTYYEKIPSGTSTYKVIKVQ